MDETSPEAFRKRFREARRKRLFAILVVTTVAVLIGRGIIWLFLPEITRDATRWTIILLLPVAWFGWWVGGRLGDEFAYDVWKEIRLAQMLAAGGHRRSLTELMTEELGEEEMYQRQQEADRAREEAEKRPPDAGPPPDAGSGPEPTPPEPEEPRPDPPPPEGPPK